MKSDVEREMKYVEFEEERAFQNYQIQLSQYNADRSRMDAFAMAEFERKNNEIATQKQQEFTMKMKQIDQDFAMKNQKPQYMTDRDWNLIAVIDWQATPVRSTNWEVVGINRTKRLLRYNRIWYRNRA